MSNDALGKWLDDALDECGQYESCMGLFVNESGKSVELTLDTSVSTYGEWIPGEGGDICLLRCMDTKKVVGVHLPLMNDNLMVFHDGPIRINTGFKKGSADLGK